MLNKLLGAVKLSSRRFLQKKRRQPPHNRHKKGWGGGVGVGVPSLPLPLKMVLPGGVVELYYMAVPAAKVMEAHPSFMVARPEVFSRPWDSLVHPDEILNPGEKFFLVPRSTVRKLRRRIRKPPPPPDIGDLSISSNISSFASQSSGTASPLINEACYSTDTETQQQGREQEHRLHKNNGNPETDDDDDAATAAARKRSQQRITRVKNIISWRPSLTAIRE